MNHDSGASPALEIRAVTRAYRRGPTIGPIDIAIDHGRVLGLVGGNGAGKTTLLRMICGLLAPTSGEVNVAGTSIVAGRPVAGLGAMIEEPAFYPWATGRASLELAAAGRRDRVARIESCLSQVGLLEAADTKTRSYSQGMRQRLGLARALLGGPTLLVLDEPSNGLDPQGIRWLRGLVREQAAAGVTVVVSSHMLGELRQMADEVLVLRTGQMVAHLDDAGHALGGNENALEDFYFSLLS